MPPYSQVLCFKYNILEGLPIPTDGLPSFEGIGCQGRRGEEVLSSGFWVLGWQSGRKCGMRNVECGIVGTGKEVLSSELKVTGKGGKGATSKEVLSSALRILG